MLRGFVEPVRIRSHDDVQSVDVRRVVGYRCATKSGYKGPTQKTYAEAREDLQRLRELDDAYGPYPALHVSWDATEPSHP